MTTPALNTGNEGSGANPAPNGNAPAGANPPGGTPDPKTPPAGTKPAVVEEDKKKAKAGEEGEKPKPKAEKRVATLADDDEDLPEDAELYQLSKKALESRLARHTKRQLRERFGTDDLDSIAKDLKDLKGFREKAEVDRKAQLSKEQLLQEERDAQKKRADEAEQKATQLEDQRDVNEVSDRYARMATPFINPKFLDKPAHRQALFGELAEHLDKKTGGKAEKITNEMVKEFWQNYAKENPEFGAKREEVVEVNVNTGTRQPGPNGKVENGGGPSNPQGKTARPNQANSMTKDEIRKTYGVRW